MLKEIRLQDAEGQFMELIRWSARGDEIVIVADDGPLVKIIPFRKEF